MPEELSSASVIQEELVSSQQSVLVIAFMDVEGYLYNHDSALVKKYVVANKGMSYEIFATVMEDSSMEPYLPQGAVLILDTKKSP